MGGQGSGRKRNSSAHGTARRDQGSLHAHFVSTQPAAAVEQVDVDDDPARDVEEILRVIDQEQPDGDAGNVAETTDLAGGTDADDDTVVVPTWRGEADAQHVETGIIDMPTGNNNARKSMKRRTGFLKECIESIDKKYQQVAARKAKCGELWDVPKAVLHNRANVNMRTSWKEFFKFRIFNWFPSEMIPSWKPKCGTCGNNDEIVGHGRNNPPRLIFGEDENYILNAPCRYYCGRCARTRKTQKEAGVCAKDLVQYTWLTTDDCVLEQLAVEDPDVYELFPFLLSSQNGICKRYFNGIANNAVKGIGPGAAAETMARNHGAKWQSRELQWAGHLRCRRLKPHVTDEVNIDASEIVKCPEYTSEEMGGITPCASWLLLMFNRAIEKIRAYLDSECLKRLSTSTMFAIDASFKVPKWMMKWGGVKLFEVLESGLNEYGEIIMQHFETTDNHRQLRPILSLLKEAGLDPSFVFSDVPARDRRLLELLFDGLKEGIQEPSLASENNHEGLPTLELRGGVQYVDSVQSTQTALRLLGEKLDEENDPEEKVLSVDMEWPLFDGGRRRGKVSVIQIASDVIPDVIVIHLGRIGSPRLVLGSYLKVLLERQDTAVTGRMIKNDLAKLRKDFPDLPITPVNVVDCGVMALQRGLVKRGLGRTTLAALTKLSLGRYLPKPPDIRIGDVFDQQTTMSEDVKMYCARDAEAGLRLYHTYRHFPNLTVRCKPEDVRSGMIVDIMPQHRTATKVFARGRVIQTSGNVRHGLKLTKTRFLVRVEEVLDQHGALHFPLKENGKRCKCSRYVHGEIRPICDVIHFSDLGPPPFNIVETCYRLRIVSPPEEGYVAPTVDFEQDTTDSAQGSTPSGDSDDSLSNSEDSSDSSDDEYDEESCSEESDDEDNVELRLSPDEIDQLNSAIDELADDEYGENDMVCPQLYLDDISEDGAPARISEEDPTADTPAQVASLETLSNTIEKILKDADQLAARSVPRENEEPVNTVVNTVDEGGIESLLVTRVLGDAFHVMDRVKVPMNHELKAAYFQALRAAIFVMDAGDVARVKRVVEKKGKKWASVMAWNFRYIALRVKRVIPPPMVLYYRMKAVFDFFANKLDTDSLKPLFNELAKKKANLVLEMVRYGYLSDPPGAEFYTRKTDQYGREMVDKDGLWLYRCFRGTNSVESMHQTLTTSFGHTRAGPRYSDNLLALVRHQLNWRSSERNRPHFPHVRHYDGRALDTINQLYEEIFGMPKFPHWVHSNNVHVAYSPYGIVPLESTSGLAAGSKVVPVKGLTNSLHYLALRQQSVVPYTPVRNKEEKVLFSNLAAEALRNHSSMTAAATFETMQEMYNPHALGTNNIYKKHAEQLFAHFKKWRKNQSRREAIKEAKARLVIDALEHTPKNMTVAAAMVPRAISTTRVTTADAMDVEAVTNDSDAASPPATTQIFQQVAQDSGAIGNKPRRRRQCVAKGCPTPSLCPGAYNNVNCLLITGGDPAKKRKRKSPRQK